MNNTESRFINDVKEVINKRESIHKSCEPMLKTGDYSIETYNRIEKSLIENAKQQIYYSYEIARSGEKKPGVDETGIVPGSECLRPVPNVFIRSGLFSIDYKNSNQNYCLEKINCQHPFEIIFSGQRLSQKDLDVWLSLIYMAGGTIFGDIIDFCIGDLLDACGRSRSGASINAIIESLYRLSGSEIQVSELSNNKSHDKKMIFEGTLIKRFFVEKRENKHKRFYVILDHNLKYLYKYNSFTMLNWNERKKLGKPLAQWLHSFYSSHAQVYDLSINYIYGLCGSKTAHDWKFQQILESSLTELNSEIKNFSYEIQKIKGLDEKVKSVPVRKRLIKVLKESSEAQKRHLFIKEMKGKKSDNGNE
ncbi:MAG: plasmid replication initiator TrfA [Methylomonas sp.]